MPKADLSHWLMKRKAAHADLRTTRIYDRRPRVTRNIVEFRSLATGGDLRQYRI